MVEALRGVRRGEPWAFAALVHGELDDLLDDDGRPLGERRATSPAKTGVPFVLKACPYDDARLGRPMNASALAQVTRNTAAVLDELASFRAAADLDAPRWEDVLTAVLHLLGAPATFLLRTDGASTVPTKLAAAHKLGAGYFGVVRAIVSEAARGHVLPVTPEALLEHAHRTHALLGASEVCAGPPAMLLHATHVLLHGRPGARPLADHRAYQVAKLFRQQVQLGIAWEHFDRALESMVLRTVARSRLRTDFYARRIQERQAIRAEAPESTTAHAVAAIPFDLSASESDGLREAFASRTSTRIDIPALGDDGGAAALDGADREQLVQWLSDYLVAQTAVMSALRSLEHALREALSVKSSAPTALHSTIFPRPAALHWLETSLGLRVSFDDDSRPSTPRLTVLRQRAPAT